LPTGLIVLDLEKDATRDEVTHEAVIRAKPREMLIKSDFMYLASSSLLFMHLDFAIRVPGIRCQKQRSFLEIASQNSEHPELGFDRKVFLTRGK
jgi:hypothetical protein